MKIAFLGTRGIPRCYSGFETFVEEVSVRLVQRGHQVTVYNRIPFNTYAGDQFQGVRIVRLPTLQTKETDSFVHSLLSTIHAMGQKYDIIYYCGVGNAVFGWLAHLGAARVVINVDGADWKRAKWSGFGRWWLRWSEALAGRVADAVIADHPAIRARYQREHGTSCELISYGAEVVTEDPGREALERFRLRPDGYLLYVSRLTPENAADVVMQAYLRTERKLPLVVVGDDKYLTAYQRKLRCLAEQSGGRILMTGYQYGKAYRELSFHARAFLFPNTIEATRPVMLEQMGMGACLVALDTESNRHVLGNAAIWFGADDRIANLAEAIREVSKPGFDKSGVAALARERVTANYCWDRVTTQYEKLWANLMEGKRGGAWQVTSGGEGEEWKVESESSCIPRARELKDGAPLAEQVTAKQEYRRVSVLGTPLLVMDYAKLAEELLRRTNRKQKTTVDFTNTHVVTSRRIDPAFAEMAKMDMILPDGMPLVWVMNWRGAGLADRVYGPTFTRTFLENCPSNFTHYFLGGSVACGDALLARIRQTNPGLQVAGRYHGWCDGSGHLGENDGAVLRELREKKPDFIWVGLGTPKQYAWISRVAPLLDSGIILSVGFAFDVNAGTKPDAPLWMQKRGLTWLHRLLTEPRRLAPRYLKYNSLFLWYILLENWKRLGRRSE
jgi:exopolysaccharide biosynthesis WecB/TagA/CpsF family protein